MQSAIAARAASRPRTRGGSHLGLAWLLTLALGCPALAQPAETVPSSVADPSRWPALTSPIANDADIMWTGR